MQKNKMQLKEKHSERETLKTCTLNICFHLHEQDLLHKKESKALSSELQGDIIC